MVSVSLALDFQYIIHYIPVCSYLFSVISLILSQAVSS